MVTFLNIVIAGLLLGGLYALIAMGLSLQYGVARVANFSHGEFIMLGGMITWTLYTQFGVNPLLSLAVCGPLTFILGFILHRTVFRRLFASSESPAIFESNSVLASIGWGTQQHGYTYLRVTVNLWGAKFGANRLVTLGFAIVIGLAFYLFVTRTRMGKAIRASAQDAATAGLMGVNIDMVLALCFALGAAMAGMAGMLISMYYPIQVVMGQEYTVIAMIVVVLGGLGSIPGSFIGGFLLGLVGSVVTYLDPGLALVAYYFIFILLLLVKPTGIMGR
jgi:branched-chain amino acid transport system permease protein